MFSCKYGYVLHDFLIFDVIPLQDDIILITALASSCKVLFCQMSEWG